jgi:LPXTG-motif cell wall-anchored protein
MSSDNAVLGTATTGGAAATAAVAATGNDFNWTLLIGLLVATALLVLLGLWVRRRSQRQ